MLKKKHHRDNNENNKKEKKNTDDIDKELDSISISNDSNDDENKQINKINNSQKKEKKDENQYMNIKQLKKEFEKKEKETILNNKKEEINKEEINKEEGIKNKNKYKYEMKPDPKINIVFDEDGNPLPSEKIPEIKKQYPSQVPTINKTNRYTLSILLPSSIVDNAQSKELRTYLIGQLARTIGIFKISEIIIYHDKLKNEGKDHLNYFIKNLQYLETPQYLRKALFPHSEDLSNSGLMNPLESSHHLRIDEWCQYREGCVLNRPINGDFSWVNIGLKKDCKINKKIPEKTRVTVRLNETGFNEKLKYYTGVPVSMKEPYEVCGIYWGYIVRVVESLDEVFDNSIYKEKYDLIIGTSDKGENYRNADYESHKDFKHGLIVFGGIHGIEGMFEDDEHMENKNDISKINKMFDLYLNTCMGQGLRTIRTEEAIMISLSVIRPELDKIKGVY